MTEPFIENLEDPEVAKSRKSIINSIIERRAKKPIILVADAEEPDEVIATQADKAVERAVEDILEAGAGRADKAIDLVETVLEAGAGQAEEAEGPKFESKLYLWPCLGPENFSNQGRSKHSRVFRPKFFESRPQLVFRPSG